MAGAAPGDIAAKQGALAVAQSAQSEAQLKTSALETLYTNALKAGGTSNELREFSQASVQSTGRLKNAVVAAFAGLVIGGLIGAALATWAANGWHILPVDARAERLRRRHPVKPPKAKPVTVKDHGSRPDDWAAPSGATSEDAVASAGRR